MDIKELMKKKKSKELDPVYKDAKMKSLGELKNMMSDMMGDDVKGLKKVTVAAPDKASLAEGLEKAKDMMGEGSPKEEASESHDEEMAESGGLSEEEEALLEKLLAKKHS